MTESRLPPNDLTAEAAVVAACLLDQAALDVVRSVVTPECFYADAHRRVFEAACHLDDASEPVDLVTVAGRLRATERLGQVGGSSFLVSLTDATPAVAHVEAHARTVRALWRQRNVITAAQRIAAEGYAADDPEAFCSQAEAAMFQAAGDGASDTEAETLAELMPKTVSEMTERRTSKVPPGIDCGLSLLNRRLGGLLPYVYVLAGRPGMGKSALAQNIAHRIAERGEPVVFVSLEMERGQIAARMVSAESKVPATALEIGDVSDRQFKDALEATQRLAGLPMSIAHLRGATLSQVRSRVRREFAKLERGKPKRKRGLVVVDYVQLMNDQRGKGQTRDEAIGIIMRGLVALAGELEVPVLALSQLNRSVETRAGSNKRPQMSDLRESGNIEQDAHGILFVYRDEYYNRDSPDKGIAEIICPKLRNGRPFLVRVKFSGECLRFDDLAGDEYEFDEYDGSNNA